jgi:lantibiotic modifying enzyme
MAKMSRNQIIELVVSAGLPFAIGYVPGIQKVEDMAASPLIKAMGENATENKIKIAVSIAYGLIGGVCGVGVNLVTKKKALKKENLLAGLIGGAIVGYSKAEKISERVLGGE